MPEPLSNTNTAGRKRSVHRRVFAAGVVALALLLLTGSGHASRASVIGDVFLRATFGVLAPSPRPAQTSATNAVVSTQQASVFSSTRVRVTQASPRTESIPEPTWFGSPSPRTSPAAAAVAVPAIPEPTWFGAPVLRTAVPTVQTRSEFGQRVSALRFPDDGREGQILMIENGKAVWKDFPGVYSPGLGRRPFPVGGSSGGESGPVQRSYGGGGGGGDSGNSGGTGGTGGLSQSDADGRYVNVPGDTMTGLLNILVDGLGLNVTGTISGSVLHAEQLLTSSGDLLVAGDAVVHGNLSGATLTVSGLKNCNTIDTDADGNFVCGTDEGGAGSSYRAGQGLTLNTITNTFTLNSTITGSLLEFTTVSGSIVHAQTVLRSSGVLLVEGATSLSGSLAVEGNSFLGGTLAVTGNTTLAAGLKLLHSDFFGCTALETDADGDLVCDSDSDTTYSVGRGLTLNGTVITLNTTLTGSSLTFQTISGSTIAANSRLTSSGVLAVEGNSFLQGTVRITSLTNCNTLDTNSSGDLVCGTDEGTTYTAAQGLVLTSNSFRLASSISGSLVNFQTVSGSTLFANSTLRSSGSLIVQTTGLFKGNLTTRGNLSGATLTVSTLKNCNTLDTDANGNLSCGTDEGSTYVAGQGIGLTGNVFRLNGTLTGSLVSFQTVSGSTISAANRLTSSGVLAVDGATYLNNSSIVFSAFGNCSALAVDSTGNLLCTSDDDTNTQYSAGQGLTLTGTGFSLSTTITGSTLEFATVSGGLVSATNRLTSSGVLAVEGNSFLQGTVRLTALTNCNSLDTNSNGDLVCGTDEGTTYSAGQGLTLNGTTFRLNSTITGSLLEFATVSGSIVHAQDILRSSGSLLVDGVVYLNNYANCTALETSNGQIVCGTDDTGAGGASFGTGSLTTYFDNRFVNVSGDTMTGALAIRSGNGTVTVDAGVLLEVLGTASGRIVHVQDQLRSSGSLLVDGAVYFNNYANCTALETSNGQIVCGTDDGGTSYFAGRGLTLTAGVFTLNTTITGSLLEFTTVSGATVSATDRLTSSGVLAVEGNSFLQGTVAVTGNTTLSSGLKLASGGFNNCTALSTDADGDVVCDTDDNTTYTAAQGLTLNGTSFRLNATITGSLLEFSTVSGATVHAQDQLRSSGTLLVEGNAILQSGLRLASGGFNSCTALSTNSSGDIVCDTDDNTTYTAAQGLTLNGTSFRLNATITGSLVRFQTVSGSQVFAANYLRSSGALVVENNSILKGNLSVSGTLAVMQNTYLQNGLKLSSGGFNNCTALSTDADGDVVCDTDDNTTYAAGRGLGLTGNVFTLNTTITGSLLEFSTVSGATVSATNRLTSSGVLAVEGNTFLQGGLRLASGGFNSCTALSTNSSGDIVCDTDDNTTYTAAQGLTLNGTSFRLNATITGSSLTFQTISGSTVTANNRLASSGVLAVEGNSFLQGTVRLTALTNCNTLDTNSNGDLICGTDGGGSFYAAGQGLTLTGTGFRLNTTITGSLVNFQTLSGMTVYARSQLRSSGSLVVDTTGLIKGNLTTRGTLSGAALTVMAGNSYLLGSVNIGSSSVDTNLKLEVIGTTSGRVLHAQDRLEASGALVVRSTTTNPVLYTDVTNGRVGIGTAAPTSDLTIASTGIPKLTLHGTNGHTSYIDFNRNNGNNSWRIEASGTFVLYNSTNAYSTTVNLMDLGTSEIVFNNDAGNTDFRIEGDTKSNLFFLDASTDNIGINTNAPGSKLALSGAMIINSTGTTGMTADTGLALEIIGTASGRVLHAQDVLRASGSLLVDGAVYFNNYANCTSLETVNGLVTCGTDDGTTYLAGRGLTVSSNVFTLNTTITGSLLEFTTVSGATVHAQDLLRSSGALAVEGNSFLQGNISLGDSTSDNIAANGLFNTSLLPAANVTYDLGNTSNRWNGLYANTGNFSGNVNMNGNVGLGDGAADNVSFNGLANTSILLAANNSYDLGNSSNRWATLYAVNGNFATNVTATNISARNTLSGSALTIMAGNSSFLGPLNLGSTNYDSNIKLEIIGMASGRVLHAQDRLASSGTLVVQSGVTFKSLTNCSALQTDSAGALSCGSAGGLSQTTADSRYVNVSGDTMTGGLIIRSGNGTAFLDSGILFEVLGVASGRILHAQDILRSSGSLIVDGNAYFNGNVSTNFIPASNATYDLGNTSLRWNNLYANTGNFSGNVNMNGNVGLGDATSDNIAANGLFNTSLLPAANVTYDLGNTSNRWNGLYAGTGNFSGNLFANGNVSLGDAAGDNISFNGSANTSILAAANNSYALGNSTNRWSNIFSVDGNFSNNISVNNLYANTNVSARNTLSGGALTIMSGNSSFLGPLNLGSTAIDTNVKLEIIGMASGRVLHAQDRLASSGTLVVQSTGLVKGNLTTRGTLSGAALTVMAGNSYLLGSVNIGSSTVDTNLKLEVIGTASGRVIHAQDKLESSGALVIRTTRPYPLLYTDTTNYRLGLGTASPGSRLALSGAMIINANGNLGSSAADTGVSLEIIGMASGRVLHAQDRLASSGTLVVQSTGLVKGNLTTRGTLSGAALTVMAGNSYLLGSVNIGSSTVDTNLKLEIIGTASGRVIHAQDQLRASGSLLVDGAVYFNNYANCTALETVNGLITCGTDDGSSYFAGRGLTLTSNVFTLNTTITGSLLEFTTVSGAIVHAQDQLRSSGTLIVRSTTRLQSGAYITGHVVPTADATYDLGSNTNRWRDLYISGTSVHMGTSVSEGVMGYNSSDGFHFTGAGGAEVRGTASGRTVHAQDSLRSSGSLIVDGLAYLNNYANCTALETANGVLTCGTDGGGAASIGDAVGSGTQGSVLFLGPSGVLAQDNTNFFYNDSLNLLKLGGTFVVGGSTTSNAGYNLISNNDSSVASHTASDQINTSDDLYIGGALEVDGYAFFDTGVRLGHTFIVGGATTSASYNKITTNDSSVATNLDSTDDLYISGSLEVDSAAFFDNSLTFSAITSCSFLATDVSGNVYCNTSSAGGDFWALTGNSGINASAQFVGTTDGTHLAFRTNNTERMRILDMGMVGINTSAPNATLDVNGNLHVGGVSNLVPYSFFATNGSSMAGHGLDGYSDVFIEQSLEVDGIAFFDSTVQISGLTNCSVLATDSSGNIFCNTSSLGGGGITEGSLAYSGGDAGSGDSSAGSSASTLALSYPSDVYVQGNYAYVTDLYAHTLNAFDVSDPADPVQIFSISTGLFTPEAVYVQGRYAYVTNQDTSILTIMDVSNPARITSVGSVTLAGLLRDVYVQGRYAYVVSNNDTLNVIDVSNPKNPIRVGVVSTNLADPYAIYVQGRYAYVADVEANAMYVFDVSDPAAPTYVSSGTNFTSLPTGIYVQGRYAYIAAQGNDGVSIYDISNPAYPVHISTTTSNMSDPESVYVQGEYMYVTNLGGTLGVYDVSNPASVSFVDSESTSLSVPRALFVLGQHAYLTDTSNSKLHVLNAFGTYIHQLGVGGFEAGTGLFRENLQVFNDTDIRGALTVGQGMNVVGGASITASGSLSYALRVNANSGALLLTTGTANSAVNAFRIMSNVTSANNPVFSIRADGTVYSDGSYNGTGADYAEWFRTADTDLVPGDAVCIDVTRENSVRKCRGDGDPDVIGIVSTNPSFVGNVMSGADGVPVPGTVLVGLIGQVPAKAVIASGSVIRPGDSLTAAALSGYVRKAMAGESTVGVALTGLTGNTGTTGTIQVLISRRNQSLTTEAVSERVLQTVQDLKIQDELELSLQQAVAQFSASGTLMQPISEEVSRQVSALNVQSIEERLAALSARIDSLSGGTVTVAGDSALNALAARISQLETSLGGSSAGTGTTSADLVASTLNVEDTLIVGSNARIAGDLELDGTLRVSSLFIPGIVTIDGALTASSLDADTLTVSSGATIGGVLTIQGSLELASGATLGFASGSTVDFSTLVVKNALHVLGPVTIEGLAQFLGDVQVHGELQVSDRQAGMAKIPMSGTSVTITFDPPTTVQPIVTASPDVPVLYAVSNATMTGFTIRLAAPATEDITFSWHALGAFEFDASASSSSSSSVGIAFPVDASGVPLSSNAVWNACIRNQVTLDADGNPLSCSRYHEDYVWTHPDLSIEFTWNTQTTPPLLVLPDGYSRVEEAVSEEITEPAPEETPLEEPVTEPSSETPSDTPPPEETPSDIPADLPPAEEPVLEPEASPSAEPSGDEPVEEPALPEETPSATDEPVEAAPPVPEESVPVTP